MQKMLVVLWRLRRLFAGPAVPDLSDLLGYICPHQLHRFCHLGQCVQELQPLGWDGCGFFLVLCLRWLDWWRHRVDRVPGFLSSRQNCMAPPAHSHASESCPRPPFGSKGGDTLAWGKEVVGGANSDEGTDTLVLWVYYNPSLGDGLHFPWFCIFTNMHNLEFFSCIWNVRQTKDFCSVCD